MKQGKHSAGNKRGARKRRVWPWVLLSILAVLLLTAGLAFGYIWNILDGFRITDSTPAPTFAPEATPTLAPDAAPTLAPAPTEEPPYEDEIEPTADPSLPDVTAQPMDDVEIAEKDEAIVNYLLIGGDTRNDGYEIDGNTDTLIILTLDMKHKKLKMTSIMRDTLMDVPGYDKNYRINAIMWRVGADRFIEIIEQTFGIQIDGYATVTFKGVAAALDVVGGVDVEVTEKEVAEMNTRLTAENKVTAAGSRHLNGEQALQYMRIRHVGNGDYQRTERQRSVLTSVFNSMRDASLTDMADILTQLQKYVRTNLTVPQMLDAAGRVFRLRGCQVETLRLPTDDAHYMGKYNGSSVLFINVKKNAASLKQFIYEADD